MKHIKDNLFLQAVLDNETSNRLYFIKDDIYRQLRSYSKYSSFPVYPVIDDFFDLYLNTLEYTPDQLISMFGKKDFISEILFTNTFAIIENRDSWVIPFYDMLGTDITFFKNCFSLCLNNHHYLYGLVSEDGNDDNPDFISFKETIIEKNKNLFLTLIDIGKNNNHFNSFAINELFTENTIYSQILKDHKIFDDSLSIYDLNNHLDAKKTLEENHQFMSTYIHQIVQYKDEQLSDLIFLLDKNNNLKKFCHLILSNKYPIDFEHLDTFVYQLVNSDKAIGYISQYAPAVMRILWDHPEAAVSLINNMKESERHNFFGNIKTNCPITEGYSSTMSKWWSILFTNDNYNKTEFYKMHMDDNVLNLIFDNIKQYNAVNTKSAHNYIGRFLLQYFSTFHKTHEKTQADGYYSNIAVVKNNIESLSHCCTLIDDGFNCSFMKHQPSALIPKFLEYIKHHDHTLEEKVYDKISSNVALQIYQTVYKLSLSQLGHYEIKDSLNRIGSFLERSKMYNSLDLLHADKEKPLWTNIIVDFQFDTKSKAKKYKDGYPLAFVLCELTKGAAMNWFIEEGKLEHFSKIKYKAKTAINYFSSEDWFPKILRNLIEGPETSSAHHQQVLQSLIYSQKPVVKTLDKLFEEPQYSQLKVTYNFNKLSQSIDKQVEKKIESVGEEQVVRKNKI